MAASLASWSSSEHASSPAARDRDRARAGRQLRSALQPAAEAASSDPGDWQALMTDISENPQVPESDLVPALTAACAGVTGSGIPYGASGGSGASGSSGGSGGS